MHCHTRPQVSIMATSGSCSSPASAGESHRSETELVRPAQEIAIEGSSTRVDAFLGRCKGVIHAGANIGQERDVYARHGLRVVWIEPLPAIFDELKANIAPFAEQIAIKALLGACDNEPQVFRVSNNEGLSSSILELKYHKEIWPHVDFVGEIEMRSVTLPAALAASKLIRSFLFAMKPNDPLALTLAVSILLGAALLAGYMPARRASRIDPMVALRHE